MNAEELRALFERLSGGGVLAQSERSALYSLFRERGLKVTRCKSCIIDNIAIILHDMKKDTEREQDAERTQPHNDSKGCRWVIRKGLDVKIRGLRVNECTLTDEVAERAHRYGVPSYMLWQECK